MPTNEKIRLQVFLAHSGAASRRSSAEIVESGRVIVNGQRILDPAFRVNSNDEVLLDGKKIRPASHFVYIALHKPPKYLCTNEDEDHRNLAIDLLKPHIHQRIFNVGRLDYMTSGLIFFTNDGEFAKKLTHPSFKIEKEYEVQTKREIPVELMEEFKKGLYIDGEMYKCKDYLMRGPHSVLLTLDEGKNREIRNVFLSRNIFVKKVHRLRIGPILLKGLDSGHFRHLDESEVKAILAGKTTKILKKSFTLRGPKNEKAVKPIKKGAVVKSPAKTPRTPQKPVKTYKSITRNKK